LNEDHKEKRNPIIALHGARPPAHGHAADAAPAPKSYEIRTMRIFSHSGNAVRLYLWLHSISRVWESGDKIAVFAPKDAMELFGYSRRRVKSALSELDRDDLAQRLPMIRLIEILSSSRGGRGSKIIVRILPATEVAAHAAARILEPGEA